MPGKRTVLIGGAAAAFVVARAQGIQPAKLAIEALLKAVPGVRAPVQKLFWKGIYAAYNRRDTGNAFMNFGWAPLEEGAGPPPDGDTGTALYEHTVGDFDLAEKLVLEVGCGRGGGSAAVFSSRGPRSLVGVDLAKSSIDRAQEEFGREGLAFTVGDAEDLPFGDESFDVVLNVESAHCYPDVPAFLAECARVLKPGGTLLLSDLRFTPAMNADPDEGPVTFEDVATFRAQLAASPFEILEEEVITPNVKRALELDSPRRREIIERDVPPRFQSLALTTAGVVGTAFFDDLAAGKYEYLRLKLVKPA